MKQLTLILLFLTSLYATNISDYINKQNCDQIVDKQIYTVCYDYKLKSALFVAYTIDGNLVNKENIKKRPSFYTEKNLKKQHRATNSDYKGSGYDKGHLAFHSAFDYNEKTLAKTYSLINIVAMSPSVNRYQYIKAERLSKQVATKLGYVNVIDGVIYNIIPKRIGKNQIAVPSGYWKMLYNDDKKYKKCFYYKNNLNAKGKGNKLKIHLVDCSSLK